MNFHILTLFPEMVLTGLNTSITGRAIRQHTIGVEAVNIRDFTQEKHGRVDDYPYGGGAGMLMQAQPVYDAFVSVRESIPETHKKRVIYVTPQGRPFTQRMAEELAQNDDLVLLCGHYEGVDERVLEEIVTDYISIGDYVLTGGELAAMVIVDAVSRLVPSVLHNDSSAQTESFWGNLLEYPQYSRPESWHGKRVPTVLLSGNQSKIDCWRRQEAKKRTAERRPDLYAEYLALQACEQCLRDDKLHHMDMLELIRGGRAVLVASWGREFLLEDCRNHTLFHAKVPRKRHNQTGDAGVTAEAQQAAELDEHARNAVYLNEIVKKHKWIAVHQKESVQRFCQLGCSLERECRQFVYTRKEQLPISGLYGVDGKNSRTGLSIEILTADQFAQLEEFWRMLPETFENRPHMAERIAGALLGGAFLNGRLVGVIGSRSEGCVDLLAVLPQYRQKKIATALETYWFNRQLRSGATPYGQTEGENEIFFALQDRLGVCVAQEHVYWMKSKEN